MTEGNGACMPDHKKMAVTRTLHKSHRHVTNSTSARTPGCLWSAQPETRTILSNYIIFIILISPLKLSPWGCLLWYIWLSCSLPQPQSPINKTSYIGGLVESLPLCLQHSFLPMHAGKQRTTGGFKCLGPATHRADPEGAPSFGLVQPWL